MGTGLGIFGGYITVILGNQVTLNRAFDEQAAGTYSVFGGLGTYVVNSSATLSGTTLLFDLPVDSDYVYLKKVSPEGNNPTFTNGETITTIITEVPANSQTYRRWFLKARMGIKKRFGRFSTPTITDRDGNFRYTPNPVASGRLGDLSDVTLTNPVLGDFLWYNGTKWINENEPSVTLKDSTLQLTRNNDSAGEDYENEVTLRLNNRITDTNSYINNEGGPSIEFSRSSGGVFTKNWVSGGAVGAFTVTLNNSTDLAIGHKLTGTGLPEGYGALITNIAGPIITLNTAFTQQAAGSYTTGTPIAFGQIAMEWHGTNNLHKFRVTTSTDDFQPGSGSPPPYPNSPTLIESTKNYTDINGGVLYVDAVNNRVGIKNLTPAYDLEIGSGSQVVTQLALSNTERTAILTNNAGDDLLTLNYAGANRLQFNLSNQYFPSGRLGVNTTTPSVTLDVNGDAFINGNAVVALDLAVNGGGAGGVADITSTAPTGNLFNAGVNDINIGNATTAVRLGSNSATSEILIKPQNLVGDRSTQHVFNTLPTTTVEAFGKATTVNIGDTTGMTTIRHDLTVDGGNINLNGVATAGQQPFITFQTQPDGVNSMYGIRGISTVDDPWFIGAGSTGDDQGYLEIATGDNIGGTNNGGQIYVRQYNGAAPLTSVPWFGGNGVIVNELVLLTNVGNTVIPRDTSIGGDLAVNGSATGDDADITTTNAVGTVFDSTATTVRAFGAAAAMRLGATTGTATIRNPILVGTEPTQAVYNSIASTLNAFGAATSLNMGATTGTATIRNPILVGTEPTQDVYNSIASTVNAFGGASTLTMGAIGGITTLRGDLAINGGDLYSTQTTFNLLNRDGPGSVTDDGPTTVNAFTNSTATLIGAATGTTTTGNNLSMRGTTLSLNSDGTGTEDISIVFERGTSDAVIKWNETTERFDFNRPITTEFQQGARFSEDLYGAGFHGAIIAGLTGTISTAGELLFPRDNIAYPSANATIRVDRISGADATLTWDESIDSWVFNQKLTTNQITATSAITAEAGVYITADKLGMYPGADGSGVETTVHNVSAPGSDPVYIDFWSKLGYRTAKYTLSMTKNFDYHSMEIMVIHNGTTAFMNVYSEIFTNVSLGTVSVDIIANDVLLSIDPTTTGTLEILMERKLFQPYDG
jgi:hypothetical protein